MDLSPMELYQQASDGPDAVVAPANSQEPPETKGPQAVGVPPQSTEWEPLSSQMAYVHDDGGSPPTLLLRVAERLAPFDAQLSNEVYLEAFGVVISAGRLGGEREAVAVAKAARRGTTGAGTETEAAQGGRPAARWSDRSVHRRLRSQPSRAEAGIAGIR